MPPPKSRRTTLGPVNGVNRRKSMGIPGTPSSKAGGNNNNKAKPPRGRQSMLPRVGREPLVPPSPARSTVSTSTHSSRRKSVGAGGGGSVRRQSFIPAVKNDPRPISEKSYQTACAKKLLEYLVTSDYEYPIALKSLTRPSGKDFNNICSFLLRKIDPSFQMDGSMKFEDEVAMNFKAMGYPYPISKTALVAAGSPHTWPALLAALTWLMEHLKCMEVDMSSSVSGKGDEASTGQQFESLEELEKKTDKAFFNFLSGAYTAFLRGDQTMSDQLTDQLVDMFEHDNMIVEREIERVTDLNAAIVEKINHLGQQAQSLPTLAKKREDYATDLEQFHDLVRQMDEHKDALEKKVKERTAELQETNDELEKMTAKIAELQGQIQSQDLSVEDVRKMQTETIRTSETLERATALKQKNKESLWESESEVNRLFEELDASVEQFNATLGDLSLVLEEAGQLKMTIRKELAASGNQSDLLGVDIESQVQRFLSSYKDESAEQTSALRRELQNELDEMEAREEALTEAMDTLQIFKDKKTKCEESMEREREQQEAALAVRVREVDAMESKIQSLRDPAALEEQIARYQRQCTQLEALQMKHQEENISQKKAVQDEINAAIRAITEHNDYVRKQFAELQQYVLQKKAALGRVSMPSGVKM